MISMELITQIMAIVGTTLTLATMIAKLTPTHKDDDIVEKIRKLFDKISRLFLPDIQSRSK